MLNILDKSEMAWMWFKLILTMRYLFQRMLKCCCLTSCLVTQIALTKFLFYRFSRAFL